MTIFYLVLAIVSGLCMAFQSPTNATLSRHVGNLQATSISFGGGAICLLVLTLIIGTGDLSQIGDAPIWQLFGGLYGVCIVLAITYAIPRLGAALSSTILLLGQIGMGAVIDTFGLLQLDAVPLETGRVIGILSVLVGIVFVYIGKKKQESEKTYGKEIIIVVIFTFLAGVCGAIQAPTNQALSGHVENLEASLICFTVGFLLSLVITLFATKGHLASSFKGGVEWWMLLGGVYGAAIVFINMTAVVHLGSAFLMICVMLGQLGGGMLVDSFGLLKTAKIKMNSWRWAGMAVIAMGVVIVAVSQM